jgi:ABC-type dipeptide/oligopeptide/nickel transport system permease component
LFWALPQVRDPFEDVGAFIGVTLGALLYSALFALLISLFIAGIMSMFKKNFLDSFTRGYSIGVLAVPGIVVIGNLLSCIRN